MLISRQISSIETLRIPCRRNSLSAMTKISLLSATMTYLLSNYLHKKGFFPFFEVQKYSGISEHTNEIKNFNMRKLRGDFCKLLMFNVEI